MTEPTPQPQYAAPATAPIKKKRRWILPTVVGVIALFIGIGIGGGGDSTDTADAPAAEAPAKTDDAAIKAAEQRATDAEKALADAQADLDARKAELDSREAAITTAEVAFDANNLEPGTYIVGTDIAPGKWKGTATEMCYLGQNNGNDIMWNDISTGGQWVATVEDVPGSTFEFQSSCGNAAKVG
jgi:hypothetical protein